MAGLRVTFLTCTHNDARLELERLAVVPDLAAAREHGLDRLQRLTIERTYIEFIITTTQKTPSLFRRISVVLSNQIGNLRIIDCFSDCHIEGRRYDISLYF